MKKMKQGDQQKKTPGQSRMGGYIKPEWVISEQRPTGCNGEIEAQRIPNRKHSKYKLDLSRK